MSTRAAVLRQNLYRNLGPRARFLRAVVAQAVRVKAPIFLVGGPVRDLLLELPIGDLDLLVGDNLDALLDQIERRLSAEVSRYPRFHTATIATDGERVDLTLARTETYAKPGALPEVKPAAVHEDFARRDFTVNAMALPLHTGAGRELVDPFDGQADLTARRLRILHDASFIDDPTRLFRASRYAARLGFRLEPGTTRAAKTALMGRALDTLSGNRVMNELDRMLDESSAARAAKQADQLGLFRGLQQHWRLNTATLQQLRKLDRAHVAAPWPEAANRELQRASGFRALFAAVPAKYRSVVLDRLTLRGRRAEAVRGDLRVLSRLRRALAHPLTAGKLDAVLDDVSEAALLWAFCALPPPAPRHLSRFALKLRHRPSGLDGRQAKEYGAVGRDVGELLRVARQRELDGKLVDESWARRWLARRAKVG